MAEDKNENLNVLFAGSLRHTPECYVLLPSNISSQIFVLLQLEAAQVAMKAEIEAVKEKYVLIFVCIIQNTKHFLSWMMYTPVRHTVHAFVQ